jgi:hypothetical protein
MLPRLVSNFSLLTAGTSGAHHSAIMANFQMTLMRYFIDKET